MEELSEQDKVKESIRFGIEKFRLAVVCVLTFGGGTISLVNDSNKTAAKHFFIAMGLILTTAALVSAFKFFFNVKQQIK